MKKCLRRGLPKREYRDGPVGRQREGTRLQRRLGRILEEMGVSVIEEYAVGRYQLDFFCAEYWVAFEADGPIHGRRLNRDRLRDKEILDRLGIKILRLTPSELSNAILAKAAITQFVREQRAL